MCILLIGNLFCTTHVAFDKHLKETIEMKYDPEKMRLPLIYFKPFICGLISMLGDMILACQPTLRLPALFLSVFAYKQGLCVL